MQEFRELLKTPRARVGLAGLSIAIAIVAVVLSALLPRVNRTTDRPQSLAHRPALPPDYFDPIFRPPPDAPIAPGAPMMQQRPDLEPLIRTAVSSALDEALDTKLSQQTDRVLRGIYAAAGILAAFMALIATGVWKLYATVIRQAEALGEIRGFLQAAFPNVAVPPKTARPSRPHTTD